MEKERINRYIINFRRFISPFLKEGVSVKATAYPYVNGAVIVYEMNFNQSNNTDFKSESDTMNEAMRKTNLFDKPEDATIVTDTKIVWNKNYVVVLKGDKDSLWDEKAAKTDVDNLIKSINKK